MTAPEIQSWLVDRVARAVGVPPSAIDVAATFTDHGLDSVTALSITGELEVLLGRQLDATLLFERPTIRRLAVHLAAAE